MSAYGYVRVSTRQQRTKRQIDNIKTYFPNAIVYEEKQTGTNIESRKVMPLVSIYNKRLYIQQLFLPGI